VTARSFTTKSKLNRTVGVLDERIRDGPAAHFIILILSTQQMFQIIKVYVHQ